MQTTEQKRKYEKPSMKVFPLRQKPRLMVGSFTGSRGEPYGDPTEY